MSEWTCFEAKEEWSLVVDYEGRPFAGRAYLAGHNGEPMRYESENEAMTEAANALKRGHVFVYHQGDVFIMATSRIIWLMPFEHKRVNGDV